MKFTLLAIVAVATASAVTLQKEVTPTITKGDFQSAEVFHQQTMDNAAATEAARQAQIVEEQGTTAYKYAAGGQPDVDVHRFEAGYHI